MQAVVLLLIGLVMGIFGTTSVLNALQREGARPRSVMTLLGYHMQAARKASTAKQCDVAAEHLQVLAVLSPDVAALFPSMGEQDPTFKKYARDFHSAATAAAAAGRDCATISEGLGRVSDTCKACHRDFNP